MYSLNSYKRRFREINCNDVAGVGGDI